MNAQKPELSKNMWVRKPNEFAVRIDESDLEGVFSKGLRIETGTRALFFKDGAYIDELPAGYFDVKSVKGGSLSSLLGLGPRVVVLLVDDGDSDLIFDLSGFRSSDHYQAAVRIQLTFKIAYPEMFFTQCVRSKRFISTDMIHERYSDEITNALMEFAAGMNAEKLTSFQDVKHSLVLDIEKHMATSLQRDGLKLIQIRSIKWNIPGLQKKYEWKDEVRSRLDILERNLEAEALLGQEHSGKLAGMKRRIQEARAEADVLNEEKLIKLEQGIQFEIDELKKTVELEDQAIGLRHKRLEQIRRMRAIVHESDQESAKEGFEHDKVIRRLELENEKDNLFTRDEMEDLHEGVNLRSMDRKDRIRARLVLTEKLKLKEETEQELLKIDLKYKKDSESARTYYAIEEQNQRSKWILGKHLIEQGIEAENLVIDADRLRKEKEAQDVRVKLIEDQIAVNQVAVSIAKTGDEIERIKIERNRLETQLDMELLKQVQANSRYNRAENMRIDRENAFQKLQDEVHIRQQDLEIRMRQQREEMDLRIRMKEQERIDKSQDADNRIRTMEAMGRLPIEALLANSPIEQAELIRKLKRDERFSMMSEEQIKATQLSELPPHIAEVLKEQYKNTSSKELLELERRYSQQSQDKMQREMELAERRRQEDLDRMERLDKSNKDLMRDMFKQNVDIAQTGPKGAVAPQGPTVIYPPGGGAPTVMGSNAQSAESSLRICTQCGRQMKGHENFCPGCGNKLK